MSPEERYSAVTSHQRCDINHRPRCGDMRLPTWLRDDSSLEISYQDEYDFSSSECAELLPACL